MPFSILMHKATQLNRQTVNNPSQTNGYKVFICGFLESALINESIHSRRGGETIENNQEVGVFERKRGQEAIEERSQRGGWEEKQTTIKQSNKNAT